MLIDNQSLEDNQIKKEDTNANVRQKKNNILFINDENINK